MDGLLHHITVSMAARSAPVSTPAEPLSPHLHRIQKRPHRPIVSRA